MNWHSLTPLAWTEGGREGGGEGRGRERGRKGGRERGREGGREGRKREREREGGEIMKAPHSSSAWGFPLGFPPSPQLICCGFEQLLLPCGHNTIGALTVQVHMYVQVWMCTCFGREGAWPQLPAMHASCPASHYLPP